MLRKLSKSPELLQAIVSNDDNLSYGFVISVYTGDDEPATALTDDGMDELEPMLKDARRSPQEWNNFLDSFVNNELLVAGIRAKSVEFIARRLFRHLVVRHRLFAKADGLRRRSRIAVARRSAVARRLD